MVVVGAFAIASSATAEAAVEKAVVAGPEGAAGPVRAAAATGEAIGVVWEAGGDWQRQQQQQQPAC